MEQYEMLDNIRRHSIVVERIASFITHGLIETGKPLSLEMVTAGALMHDIAKTICLSEGGDHAARGEEICRKNQLEEIADLVGEHVNLKRFDPEGAILEKEIVYYADKRVTHDRIVTLKERLEDLFQRYGKGNRNLEKRIAANFRLCQDVEQKLFARLPFRPGDISGLVGTGSRS
jgi:putative nucleotidyltransferase with HDIG domain